MPHCHIALCDHSEPINGLIQVQITHVYNFYRVLSALNCPKTATDRLKTPKIANFGRFLPDFRAPSRPRGQITPPKGAVVARTALNISRDHFVLVFTAQLVVKLAANSNFRLFWDCFWQVKLEVWAGKRDGTTKPS